MIEEKQPRKKQEAVRSANPMAAKPKEKPADKVEIKQQPVSAQKQDNYKESSEIDDYEDNWDMSDTDLQDNSDNKQAAKAQHDKENKSNNLFDSKMQNVVNFDEIPTIKDSKPSLNDHSDRRNKIDFFGQEQESDEDDNVMNPDDFDDLEKDFVNEKTNNPFGKSITKEVLQQSKREAADLLRDVNSKKNLEIEIDENEDFNTLNEKAQQNLNDQLQRMEENQNQYDDAEEIDEQYIVKEFANLYDNDPELQEMLGEYPDRYTLEEKLSIIQAYKKGGGVQGLAEIIDDEDDDEDQMVSGAQGAQGGHLNQN